MELCGDVIQLGSCGRHFSADSFSGCPKQAVSRTSLAQLGATSICWQRILSQSAFVAFAAFVDHVDFGTRVSYLDYLQSD